MRATPVGFRPTRSLRVPVRRAASTGYPAPYGGMFRKIDGRGSAGSDGLGLVSVVSFTGPRGAKPMPEIDTTSHSPPAICFGSQWRSPASSRLSASHRAAASSRVIGSVYGSMQPVRIGEASEVDPATRNCAPTPSHRRLRTPATIAGHSTRMISAPGDRRCRAASSARPSRGSRRSAPAPRSGCHRTRRDCLRACSTRLPGP